MKRKFFHPISKRFGVFGLVLTVLLTMVMIVANVALSRYSNTISSTLDLNKQISAGGDEATYQKARNLTQEIAGEGATLLKNTNGALPLDTKKINVFGYGSVNLVYGGSGSGSTSGASYNDTLKQSFEAEGLSINEDLWNYYTKQSQSAGSWNVFSPNGGDYNIYDAKCTDVLDIMDSAKRYSDTAVVVFSRAGGEGGDLPMDMGVTDSESGEGLIGGDAGKSYLELQSAETDLLKAVEKNFEHVIVLVNSSHAMELGFLEDAGVDAALQIAGPGATGMRGVADVLLGKVNPSGHLVDTYAYDVKSAPSYYNMGDCYYTDYQQQMSDKYFYFEENIYTGYRWYETAAADKAVITASDGTVYDYGDYDSIVQYPFGYGLSYGTDFSQEIVSTEQNEDSVTLKVHVTNNGTKAGKDVVQVYYNPPYTDFDAKNSIEKSTVNLIAFEKTDDIQPGAAQDITVTVTKEDMASYSYAHENSDGTKGAYLLEQGDYALSINKTAHEKYQSVTVNVPQTIWYDNDNPRQSDKDGQAVLDDQGNPTNEPANGDTFKAASNLFQDMTDHMSKTSQLTRANGALSNTATFPTKEEKADIPAAFNAKMGDEGRLILQQMDLDADTTLGNTAGSKVYTTEKPTSNADNGLTLSDLRGVDFNDTKWDQLLDQLEWPSRMPE